MDEKTIKLSDGRTLGYEILGDADGSPLFFFHGTPGSRLVLAEDDLLAQVPGLRLILPDRPGCGLSDPAPARTLIDWPGDVAQLADHLGLERFGRRSPRAGLRLRSLRARDQDPVDQLAVAREF